MSHDDEEREKREREEREQREHEERVERFLRSSARHLGDDPKLYRIVLDYIARQRAIELAERERAKELS